MEEDIFKNIVGQETAKKAIMDWYLHEDQPLLIYGPSGYGKTNFATALGAREIDATHVRSNRPNSILKPIKEAEDGDILFIDEIHALPNKIIESLYKIIDKGTFYEEELCMELLLPKARFVFATNIIDKLPVAFVNRCRMVELQEYTEDELKEIIHKRYSEIDKKALETIVKASKGVPRTALSISKSIIAGAKTDKCTEAINEDEVNSILESRMDINPATGLSSKEFLIIQKVIERGRLSTAAVANILKTTSKDAQKLYIDPLRASEWLSIGQQGVIPGPKAHYNYKVFAKRSVLKVVGQKEYDTYS